MNKQRPRKAVLGVCIALLALVLIAFYPALFSDFVNFDDDEAITKNPFVYTGLSTRNIVWSWTTIYMANYFPITWMSHMLDCQLFGLNPRGHHAMSLFFHSVNVLFLFFLLKRMTGQVWRSALVAALFALHPLRVESVVWVSERKDLLSTLFWLLSTSAYLNYLDRPTKGRYALMALWLILGLLTKPMLVTLPFALMLLDVWPLKRVSVGLSRDNWLSLRKSVVEKLPLFFIIFFFCVLSFHSQAEGKAVELSGALTLPMRLSNAVVSYGHYLRMTVWPEGHSIFYPHLGPKLPLWQVIGATVLIVSISAGAALAVRRRPSIFVGWFWFLGTFVPVIGIIQIGGQAYADRYTYVPHIGLLMALVWLLPESVFKERKRILTAALSLGVLLTLTGLSYRQSLAWKNSETLFKQALENTENNHIAHGQLGMAYLESGKNEDAVEQFTAAVAIRPRFFHAYVNRATGLGRLRRYEEAVKDFEKALELRGPHSELYGNMANMYARLGQSANARRYFQLALEENPRNALAHYNFSIFLKKNGQDEEARQHYIRAVQLEPRLRR